MKPSEVLRKARALIEKPERWTQRMRAGSMTRASGEKVFRRVLYWLGSALARPGEPPLDSAEVIAFNDTHTHAEVLSIFDRAIAAAEARGE